MRLDHTSKANIETRARSSGDERLRSKTSPRQRSADVWTPKISGGDIEEVTPDPIPNSEVKLLGADGTAGETQWESRTPPGFLQNGLCFRTGRFLFCPCRSRRVRRGCSWSSAALARQAQHAGDVPRARAVSGGHLAPRASEARSRRESQPLRSPPDPSAADGRDHQVGTDLGAGTRPIRTLSAAAARLADLATRGGGPARNARAAVGGDATVANGPRVGWSALRPGRWSSAGCACSAGLFPPGRALLR